MIQELKKKNKIPWSRGNGWVLFSLSELMEVLPDEHEYFDGIVRFFNELVTGILKVQGDKGLWHQILDDDTTYEESSATAMFLCSVSRGIRKGYLNFELEDSGIRSVYAAWEGLKKYCVDKHGNLYGVCQGSGFSFSRSYYRRLGWRFNDTHGIGIVLLAGVEKMLLDEYL